MAINDDDESLGPVGRPTAPLNPFDPNSGMVAPQNAPPTDSPFVPKPGAATSAALQAAGSNSNPIVPRFGPAALRALQQAQAGIPSARVDVLAQSQAMDKALARAATMPPSAPALNDLPLNKMFLNARAMGQKEASSNQPLSRALEMEQGKSGMPAEPPSNTDAYGAGQISNPEGKNNFDYDNWKAKFDAAIAARRAAKGVPEPQAKVAKVIPNIDIPEPSTSLPGSPNNGQAAFGPYGQMQELYNGIQADNQSGKVSQSRITDYKNLHAQYLKRYGQ